MLVLLLNAIDLGAPLFHTYPRPQAANNIQKVIFVGCELLGWDVLFQRYPDLCRAAGVDEPARQDPDNLVVFVVEPDWAPQHVRRSAEAALPQPVADQGDM